MALGMENGVIPNSSITVSSYSRKYFDGSPKYARLNNEKFWQRKENDEQPWIQVDLNITHTVKGMLTQGAIGPQNYRHWTSQLTVKTGTTAENLHYIEDHDGQPRVGYSNH